MPISKDDEHDVLLLLKEGNDITGATMPPGGSSARGWLSALFKTITTIFPAALSNGRFKAESGHLAPLEINCTATALGDILPETDVSNYRYASVSVNSNIAANQMQFLARNSQTGVWFVIPVEQRLSPTGSYLNGLTTGTQNIYGVPLAYKYFKITLVAYTPSTISSITVLLYQHPPERLTVTTRTLIDGGNVGVGLPTAIALSDTLNRITTTQTFGAANLVDNGTNLSRWKSPAVTSGEGSGRGKVAQGTEPISLGTGITGVNTGAAIALGSAYNKITMQLAYSTATITAINCDLQGSLNGNNWFTLATLTDTTNGAKIVSSDVPVTHIRYKLNNLTGTSLSIQFLACAI